jgi:molybdopterin-guanine dinucleotide biosynthesis protein A
MSRMVASDPTPVLVLAGGASRRMGHDKRVALIDGVPMLLRTIERLAPSPTLVILDPQRPPSIALPGHVTVVPDSRPGEGPLAALEAGLGAVSQDIVLVVGADMPRLAPAVLQLLVGRLADDPSAHVACLADEDRPRPLPLALRRAPVLARLPALLDAGERRLRVLLEGARSVPPSAWLPLDPTRGTLQDVDTPADLAATR